MYKAKIRSHHTNVESVRQKCVSENQMENGESLLGEPVQMGGLNIVWRSSASGSKQQQSAMDSGMDEKQINQCCCGNKTKRSLIDEVRSLKERLILKDSVINELLKSNQRNGKSVEVAADCFTCGKCDFKLSRERQKVETLTDELEKLQLYITDFPRLRKGDDDIDMKSELRLHTDSETQTQSFAYYQRLEDTVEKLKKKVEGQKKQLHDFQRNIMFEKTKNSTQTSRLKAQIRSCEKKMVRMHTSGVMKGDSKGVSHPAVSFIPSEVDEKLRCAVRQLLGYSGSDIELSSAESIIEWLVSYNTNYKFMAKPHLDHLNAVMKKLDDVEFTTMADAAGDTGALQIYKQHTDPLWQAVKSIAEALTLTFSVSR